MEYRTTTANNLVSIDPVPKDHETLIYLGTPCHTTPPYDTYARLIVRDARIAFARARIHAEVVSCHRRIATVGFGSGRDGAVRFGDDMLPPDVQAIVAKDDEARALRTWTEYQRRKFLPKPFSVLGHRWFNPDANHAGSPSWHGSGGAWVVGGAWIKTIHNAVGIATALGRDISRLEAYLASRTKNENCGRNS